MDQDARGTRPPLGHSASPLLVGGKLIVQFTDLAALDPESGKPRWRRSAKQTFGSPVAARVGDLNVIVTPSGLLLNADNGRELADCGIHLEYNAPIGRRRHRLFHHVEKGHRRQDDRHG